uniref:HCP-like protein n=1 Tax=Moniliophthora roreri TaxID=221103 RepID=A0A0W0G873_MONRR
MSEANPSGLDIRPKFMAHENRSTPSLSPQPQSGPPPPLPGHAPPPYDPAAAFDQLRLTDPLANAMDPIQRSKSSMSMRSIRPPPAHYHQYRPQHTIPEHDNFDTSSRLSGSDQASFISAPDSYYAPPPQHWAPPQQQGAGYDHLYAAASNVLGMGPPPNAGPPPSVYGDSGYTHSQSSLGSIPYQQAPFNPAASTSSFPPPGHPQHYPHDPNANYAPPPPHEYAASIHSQTPTQSYAPSIAPSNDGDFEMRPQLGPRQESATIRPNTVKSKAVDLSTPPYTKEYIDSYRQRIKSDPDPEAHFLYAKYLVDAARKIRQLAGNGGQERNAKKYSEYLVQEALKVFRRLATQGEAFPEAQFYLAGCYGSGALGLQVDHERAYHLYLQAAKSNHPAAAYRVAVCNEIGAGTRRDPLRAAAFYRKSASLGDTAAMYKLGMILLNGLLGEQKSPREAVGWLKRAAEQADEENPHALHELGLLYESGAGGLVAQDPLYAKQLFTQAAHLGYTQSQYKLGQCYEYGTLGCPVDPRRSIAWYTKAAEKGDAEAELALSGWYLTGSEGVLKQSDSEAYLWARRAANKGLSKAEYAVGYYAEVGIGIKQDVEFARRWYMRAAAQGNKRAMNRLTEMKRAGSKGGGMARPTRQQAKDECVIM